MIIPFIVLALAKVNENTKEEVELIKLIAQKDEQAFSELYDRYGTVLFSLILKVVHKYEVAEDIMQDVFVLIWNKAYQFSPQKASPYTWLATITRNKAIDHIRSKTHKNTSKNTYDPDGIILPALESEFASPLDNMIGKDRERILGSAMAEIPEEQKEVIMIAYVKGFTHSEIAEYLNIPLGTVKTRMRQGMMKLKDLITQNSLREI